MEGQIVSATNRLSELVTEGDPFSQRSLAHMLAARGEVYEAYRIWETVGDFNSVEVWASRAESAGAIDEAYAGLRTAYRIDPLAGTQSLAQFLVSQEAEAETAAVLHEALGSQSPDYLRFRWLNELGELLVELEAWGEASTVFEELQMMPGGGVNAYLGLARIAALQEENEAALNYLALGTQCCTLRSIALF